MPTPIPFNRPCLTGNELAYVREAMELGHASGDGEFTRRCHRLLEERLAGSRVLLTTSCTHALEMAALLAGIEPGDEVVVPSFTFVSTINAFVLRGARPVFCDIREDTLNLDERLLPGLVGPRTKVIVPVHYAGVGCRMESILSTARRVGALVVEDNAHGLFGQYRGAPLGTFGAFATLSFHETKNISCGEGGALVINDPEALDRAEILREKGTNRSRFFRGDVDKYTWVDLGSSYLPSDLLAAFLCAQLECAEAIQADRKAIWARYAEALADWADANGVVLPTVPGECLHPAHLFYMLLPDLRRRQALIAHLKQRDIKAVFHYQPLHLSPMGEGFGGRAGQCPVTESVSDRLVRLPLYRDLGPEEQARVIEAVREFRC